MDGYAKPERINNKLANTLLSGKAEIHPPFPSRDRAGIGAWLTSIQEGRNNTKTKIMKSYIFGGVFATLAIITLSLATANQLITGINFQPEWILLFPLLGVMTDQQFQAEVMRGVSNLASSQKFLRNRLDAMETRGAGGYFAPHPILDNPELRTELKRHFLTALRAEDLNRPDFQRKAVGHDSEPGSALVSPGVNNALYDILPSYGQFSSLGRINMGTKVEKLVVITERPAAGFIGGGTPIPKDESLAIASPQLEAKKIAARVDVEIELIEDSGIPIEEMLLEQTLQSLAARLDHAVFVGNGEDDTENGGITGIFNGGVAVIPDSARNAVSKLKFEDFLATMAAVDPVVLTRRPRWWIHPSMLSRIMGVTDGNGRPLFLRSVDAPAFGAMGSILGFPVTMVSAAPNGDGPGQKVCAFGDPEAYAVGIRTDFRFDSSDHFLWSSVMRCFRAVMRAGGIFRKNTGIAVLATAGSSGGSSSS